MHFWRWERRGSSSVGGAGGVGAGGGSGGVGSSGVILLALMRVLAQKSVITEMQSIYLITRSRTRHETIGWTIKSPLFVCFIQDRQALNGRARKLEQPQKNAHKLYHTCASGKQPLSVATIDLTIDFSSWKWMAFQVNRRPWTCFYIWHNISMRKWWWKTCYVGVDVECWLDPAL